MIKVTDSPIFRIGRAAALIGISAATLRSWCLHGYVPHSRSKRHQLVFSPNDIVAIKQALKGMRIALDDN